MKAVVKVSKLIITILLIAVLSASVLAVVSLNNESYEKPLKIVFLGDSISEGILGPAPIHERDSYAFYGIISEINKYEGFNRAVSGHRTYQFEDFIKAGDKNAYLTATHIREADVITISMLANDLLQLGAFDLVLDRELTATVATNSLANAKIHFYAAIDELRRLNPNAHIFMFTQYNPAMDDPCMFNETRIEMIRETGMEPSEYRAFFQIYIDIMNDIIKDYLEEHPGAYHILDVAKEFDDIYLEDKVRAGNLLFSDVLHPSNEGHAVIGGVIQKKLEELGLANREKALANYKNLRIKQAHRLFDGIIDVDSLVKKVNDANSYEEVTKVFFAATNGHTVNNKDMVLAATPKQPATYAKNETTLPIDSLSLIYFHPTLVGIAIDYYNSYVKFKTDGTMEIVLYLNEGIVPLLNNLLGGIDLSQPDEYDEGFSDFVAKYGDLFLGRDKDNSADVIPTIKNSLGIELIGIDFSETPFDEIAIAIDETGSLPSSFTLPPDRDYGIKITARYEISSVTDYEGNVRSVIYLGKTGRRTDPYVIIDADLDGKGNPEKIEMRIEFLPLSLVASNGADAE
ncbi:MAG TPA: SGNH/GDSL hydrolase family protein [Clostridia bacterium]|nr:SGNH/GDSL hydrolase family protein [Clostridia bacterium]